jgi:hypothetical protein
MRPQEDRVSRRTHRVCRIVLSAVAAFLAFSVVVVSKNVPPAVAAPEAANVAGE